MRRSAFLTACSALFVLAGTAIAVPAILDRVPADAAVAVAVPSVENLEKDLRSLAKLFGAPAEAVSVDAIFDQIGIPGVVSKTGPMAFFVIMPTEGQDEPTMGVLFTAADFDAVTKGLSAKADGPLFSADLNGETIFVKKLDDQMVFASSNKAFTTTYEGKTGSAKAFTTLVGEMGDKASTNADLSIIINFEKVRPFVQMGLDQFQSQLESSPVPEEQLEQMTKFMEIFGGTYVKDTASVTATLNIEPAGLSLDWISRFTDGTTLAGITASAGDSGKYFEKVPNMPYLAAFAADFSNPGVQKLLAMVPDSAPAPIAPADGDKKADAAKPKTMDFNTKAAKEAMAMTTGAASVIGVSPAGLMGGLLTRMVSYTATKDPAKMLTLARENMQSMADGDAAEVKYTQGGAEVAGRKVDVFEMRIKGGEENPMAGQVMAGLYGLSGGPTGYTTTVEGGVVTTFAKSSELMEKSIKAAGGADTLSSDKTLAATAKNLPSGRVAEAYIGVRGILESVGGFLAMSNPNFKIDMPENLPPLALALSPNKGSLRATIFAPTPTLKILGDVATQMAPRGEEDEMDTEPAKDGEKPAKEGAKPAEKPKF